jgi:hypothetical protein
MNNKRKMKKKKKKAIAKKKETSYNDPKPRPLKDLRFIFPLHPSKSYNPEIILFSVDGS